MHSPSLTVANCLRERSTKEKVYDVPNRGQKYLSAVFSKWPPSRFRSVCQIWALRGSMLLASGESVWWLWIREHIGERIKSGRMMCAIHWSPSPPAILIATPLKGDSYPTALVASNVQHCFVQSYSWRWGRDLGRYPNVVRFLFRMVGVYACTSSKLHCTWRALSSRP